jgi:hypothetical protein
VEGMKDKKARADGRDNGTSPFCNAVLLEEE